MQTHSECNCVIQERNALRKEDIPSKVITPME